MLDIQGSSIVHMVPLTRGCIVTDLTQPELQEMKTDLSLLFSYLSRPLVHIFLLYSSSYSHR